MCSLSVRPPRKGKLHGSEILPGYNQGRELSTQPPSLALQSLSFHICQMSLV